VHVGAFKGGPVPFDDLRGSVFAQPNSGQPPFDPEAMRRFGSVVLLAAIWLKQLHQVPGRISQKNLRAAGSAHDVVGELHVGGTQSGSSRQRHAYAGTGAAAGRAFNSSSAKNALRLRPAEIAITPMPMRSIKRPKRSGDAACVARAGAPRMPLRSP
jgi:hypothetical protein